LFTWGRKGYPPPRGLPRFRKCCEFFTLDNENTHSIQIVALVA
jgi:hypothetical protein